MITCFLVILELVTLTIQFAVVWQTRYIRRYFNLFMVYAFLVMAVHRMMSIAAVVEESNPIDILDRGILPFATSVLLLLAVMKVKAVEERITSKPRVGTTELDEARRIIESLKPDPVASKWGAIK